MAETEIIARLDAIEKRVIELVAENAELLAALKEVLPPAEVLIILQGIAKRLPMRARALIEKAEKTLPE
jgi:hypothetical protein